VPLFISSLAGNSNGSPAPRSVLEKYHDLVMQLADACLVGMSELKRNCRVFTLDKQEF
jgi:hypothetical protein